MNGQDEHSEHGAFAQGARVWDEAPIDWLRQVFRYLPETGVVLFDGAERATENNTGQVQCWLADDERPEGTSPAYLRGRLAFALTVGRWPFAMGHRNGNTLDDRWLNLFEVIPSAGVLNRQAARDGEPIRFDEASGLWIARILTLDRKGKPEAWSREASTRDGAERLLAEMQRIDREARQRWAAKRENR